VVGDRVRLVGDVNGTEGALARIVEVEQRRTVLRRTADDSDPVERVLVANADQLVVVTALADPEPRPRLIDRALVAAYDAGLDPLLCLTKPDLADAEKVLATYRPLGVPYVVVQRGLGWPGAPACWSATAVSASPPWSMRSCRARTGPSVRSTRSPGGAGTPRLRR
jgi:putative ribosome biogenesis GTPase RsgA